MTDPELLYCLVPMSEITDAGMFSYSIDEPIYAKVQARNIKGWSTLSPANAGTTTAEVVPGEIDPPIRGGATTQTQVQVLWADLVTQQELGGATCTVLTYNV